MITLYLDDIRKLLGIETQAPNIPIRHVQDNIKRIGNHTLVFHLNKAEEVRFKKFSRLKNCYIVTDQPLLKTMPFKDKYLFAADIHAAYKTFIDYYRNLFDIPVVAVTGTCGKTTTKEMIAQVLKKKYHVVHTISSKNALHYNHDYLMSFDNTTEFGVFETAITHPGNLLFGCEFFKPTIGIMTTIGIDHLNWCKTHDNYIRTKGEMLVGLKNKGILILNNDDGNIKKIDMSNYRGKVVTFGIKRKADFFGEDIRFGETRMNFVLMHEEKRYSVEVEGLGEHTVYNALAALAALYHLGMNIKEAISYLAEYIPIRSHNEVQKGINGSLIIDDTWSSNPTSMKAALKVLHEKGKGKTKVAVLGKISYLGDFEAESYEGIAKMLIDYKIDTLITQDESAKAIGVFAEKLGMNPKRIIHCQNQIELTAILKSVLNEKTVALFKWSMLDKTNQEVLKSVIVQ